MKNDNSVILLNANYLPLQVVHWKKAVKLIVKNKATAVGTKTIKIMTFGKEYILPKVIRLLTIIRSIYKSRLPYSRRKVFERDNHTCMYCGAHGKDVDLNIDHVVPRTQGGITDFDNVVTSCYDCNFKKGGRTPSQAGMTLIKKPYQPTIAEYTNLKFNAHGFDLNELFT